MLATAIDLLRQHGLELSCIHMHLRSNVRLATLETALDELLEAIQALNIRPRVLDVGGGLAARDISLPAQTNDLVTKSTLRGICRRTLDRIPSVEELWLENGRHLLSSSGVLVIRVNDVKEHGGLRHLICDGGRTNHALVSDWECHTISTIPARKGAAAVDDS